jgi:hypothetical protein
LSTDTLNLWGQWRSYFLAPMRFRRLVIPGLCIVRCASDSIGCDTQMPSSVGPNLLDDGVVDTLGSVGEKSADRGSGAAVADQEGDDRRCGDAAQSGQDARREYALLDLFAALITSGISSTQSTAMTSAAKRVAACRP